MPHLNELSEKFSDKGLSILGVTGEGKGPTEKWIADKGAHYPYAYDKGGKFQRAMGVSGIPHSVLVDATGKIVWEGHPGSLKESDIEAALGGAFSRPMWEWAKETNATRAALQKKQFAAAITEAGKLQGDDASLKETIQKLVDGRVAGMKSANDAGDFLTAQESATRIKKECAGLDAEKEATSVLDAIAKDANAVTVIKAQLQVRKLKDEPIKNAKDAQELLKQAQRIAKAQADNAAGREAQAFADELEGKLKKN